MAKVVSAQIFSAHSNRQLCIPLESATQDDALLLPLASLTGCPQAAVNYRPDPSVITWAPPRGMGHPKACPAILRMMANAAEPAALSGKKECAPIPAKRARAKRSENRCRSSCSTDRIASGNMGLIITTLRLLAAAILFAAKRYGASKYVLLICGMLNLTGCLSFTTTERTERLVPVSTVTRTETVYVTENGTRVRRVVTVDATGRRYYVENGRTVYVDHYENIE